MATIRDSEVIRDLGLKPKKPSDNILMVVGVGGAGGNAVDYLYDTGVSNVSLVLCNTDKQALSLSPVPTKIQLGKGLGAGNDPQKAKVAALESLNDIMANFEGVRMAFITAGMGGGTGTGAAPVIAKATHDKGILTVGIVTIPFESEGRKRMNHAKKAVEELRGNVDSLIVIHNDNISKVYGELPVEEGMNKGGDVLAVAVRGIAEMINKARRYNVDFADVEGVMRESGFALMGAGYASGQDKVEKALDQALTSPLLNLKDIKGAKDILVNLSYRPDSLKLKEINSLLDTVQTRAAKHVGDINAADIIWGAGADDSLQEEVAITVVATGFDTVDMGGGKESAPAAENPDNHAGGNRNDGTVKGGFKIRKIRNRVKDVIDGIFVTDDDVTI